MNARIFESGLADSVLELCAAIEQIMNRPLRHVFAPPCRGDVVRSCANVTALHNLLGLSCTTKLADGLATLLSHQVQELSSPLAAPDDPARFSGGSV